MESWLFYQNAKRLWQNKFHFKTRVLYTADGAVAFNRHKTWYLNPPPGDGLLHKDLIYLLPLSISTEKGRLTCSKLHRIKLLFRWKTQEQFCFFPEDAYPFMLNPLCAKISGSSINIYLQYLSFLHTDMTQVVEILFRVRQGHTYSTESLAWVLMPWLLVLPGHQHPWYWPI